METATIALIFTAIGAIISYFSFQRNKNNDIRLNTKEGAETKAKLDYIATAVDEIRLDNKARDRELSEFNSRLIRLEENCKIAHKRIDTIEGEK